MLPLPKTALEADRTLARRQLVHYIDPFPLPDSVEMGHIRYPENKAELHDLDSNPSSGAGDTAPVGRVLCLVCTET